jgi:hypothetical protein
LKAAWASQERWSAAAIVPRDIVVLEDDLTIRAVCACGPLRRPSRHTASAGDR